MSLVTLGLNHQTAPLAVRERVVFHVERLREALADIKRSLAPEAAILSTCNRTELYVAGEEQPAAVAASPREQSPLPGTSASGGDSESNERARP